MSGAEMGMLLIAAAGLSVFVSFIVYAVLLFLHDDDV